MSAADYQWKLEPHCCALCLGRVASRMVVETRRRMRRTPVTSAADLFRSDPPPIAAMAAEVIVEDVRRREFRCTVCANAWAGEVKAGCACGIKLGGRDAGIRCVPNPNPRPEMPAEIIAKENL
jgi:hypothetical protein